MELNDVREFIVLAQILSFQDAAQQLYTSQSTLSRHIQRLEKSLNKELFIRNSKSVALSQAGKDFLPFATQMIHLEDLYKSSCNEVDNEISVCYAKEMQPYNVSGLFRRFETENPDITVRFISGQELLQVIEENTCDFFFHEVHFFDKFPQFKANYQTAVPPFLRDHLAVVVPGEHPLAKKGQVLLKDLVGEKLFARQSVLDMEELRSAFLAEGIELPNSSFKSVHSYVELVFLQHGLAIMSKRVAEYSTQGMDAVVLDLVPEFSVNDILFYRKGKLSASKQRFLEYVLSLTVDDLNE